VLRDCAQKPIHGDRDLGVDLRGPNSVAGDGHPVIRAIDLHDITTEPSSL
jgi:hypothetical protein